MKTTRFALLGFVLIIGGAAAFAAKPTNKKDTPPPVTSPAITTQPATPPASPSTQTLASTPAAGTQPRDMKLLVIGTDGTEPSFQAIVLFLDYLGIPYDKLLAKTQVLPALTESGKGRYQGIVLSTGNLSVCDPSCRSALSATDWTSIDNYTRDYKVRMAAFYAWPEKRYGLTAGNPIVTSDAAPQYAAFTSSASSVFSYLNVSNPLKIAGAYMYPAAITPDAGETVTPLLTVGGAPVAVVDKKADGREFLALTMDQSPYLLHSMALNYGVFNWVTNGIFLGARKIYFSPQVDDFFLANDLFAKGVTACMPNSFMLDPTYDAADKCPSDRMDSGDLSELQKWQDGLNAKTQFKNIRVSLVFNGFGSALGGGDYGWNDALTREAISSRSKFYWVNHTFDHEDLDCFDPAPNSGICTPANFNQSLTEISKNVTIGRLLALPLDSTSIVTPAISGLYNANFLKAAQQSGIRYLVGDSSRTRDGLPAKPNTGFVNSVNPALFIIPRRPVNVFYNTKSGLPHTDGSLVDEYNYLYGPNGVFKKGDGTPFFPADQTLADIVNRESDNLLSYMLKYEIYGSMWHQSNFIRYSGSKMLFTDVAGATLDKFAKLSNLPVVSMQQTAIGQYMEERMAYNAANVKATLTPGVNITFTATSSAKAPVTGICKQTCENYGGQNISKIAVSAGATITVPIN